MISSVRPSAKNALSGSGLRFSNGSTTIDASSAGWRGGGCGAAQVRALGAQVHAQVGGRLVAQRAVLLEQLVDEALEVGGHRPALSAHRRGRCLGRGSRPAPRPPSRRGTAASRSPSRTAPRRARTGRCGHRAARRAPARATCRPAVPSVTRTRWPRHRRRRRVVVGDAARRASLAMPKSSSFSRAARGEEDVVGLDVAMDDALRVRALERVGQLECQWRRLAGTRRPTPAIAERAAARPRAAPSRGTVAPSARRRRRWCRCAGGSGRQWSSLPAQSACGAHRLNSVLWEGP